MKQAKMVVLAAVALAAALALVGCAAPGVAASSLPEAAGFWLGLWHGMIFPITFFVSLFNSEVGVYAVVNNGGWYDFGFFLGVAMSMGGGAGAGARGRRKNRDQ